MEEEVLTTEQETGADQAGWLDGWDTDGKTYGGAPEEEAPLENQQEESGHPEEAQQEAGEGEEAQEAKAPPEEGEAPPEEGITIRYMGEDKTISRAEAVILSQKGMNYDAVYQRMKSAEQFQTEHQGELSLVQALAEAAGMDIPTYVEALTVQMKMQGGLTEEEARREMELDKREQALAQKEQQAGQGGKPAPAQPETDRVAKDRAAFQAAFPDVAFDQIPQEVWEALSQNAAGGLAAAYAKYLAKEAQTQVAQAQQAAQAAAKKARSPGSMRNSNPQPAKSKDEEIFAGWEFN